MKLSWDDNSQYKESHKSHVPNHQPVIYYDIFIFNHEPDHSDDDDDADPSGPHSPALTLRRPRPCWPTWAMETAKVGRATKWTTIIIITYNLSTVCICCVLIIICTYIIGESANSCTKLDEKGGHPFQLHDISSNNVKHIPPKKHLFDPRLRLSCFSSEANPICLRTSARHVAFRLVLWEKSPAVSTHPALADSAPRILLAWPVRGTAGARPQRLSTQRRRRVSKGFGCKLCTFSLVGGIKKWDHPGRIAIEYMEIVCSTPQPAAISIHPLELPGIMPLRTAVRRKFSTFAVLSMCLLVDSGKGRSSFQPKVGPNHAHCQQQVWFSWSKKTMTFPRGEKWSQ